MNTELKAKPRSILISVLFLSYIGVGLPSSLISTAWPAMYGDLSVPDTFLGIVLMIMLGVSVVGSVSSGYLGIRFRTSTTILVCVLIIAAPMLGLGLSSVFLIMCFIVVPAGFAIGLNEAVVNNHVATKLESRHMNWVHCFWGIGAALGPIIFSFGLSQFGSWRWGFVAVGTILFCIFAYMMISRPVWKEAADTKVHIDMAAKIEFDKVLQIRGVKLSIAIFFIYVVLETTVVAWGSTFLVIEKGFSPDLAAQWVSLFFIGITIGRIVAGLISVRFSNIQMVRMGFVIVAIGLAFVLIPFGGVSYVVGFFVMGVGCSPIFPSLMQDVPVLFGEKNSQSIIGLLVAATYIGATVLPPSFGAVASQLGYGIFPVFLLITLVVMILVVQALYRAHKS